MEKDEPRDSPILGADNTAAIVQSVGRGRGRRPPGESRLLRGPGVGGPRLVEGTKPFHFSLLFPPSKAECGLGEAVTPTQGFCPEKGGVEIESHSIAGMKAGVLGQTWVRGACFPL